MFFWKSERLNNGIWKWSPCTVVWKNDDEEEEGDLQNKIGWIWSETSSSVVWVLFNTVENYVDIMDKVVEVFDWVSNWL